MKNKEQIKADMMKDLMSRMPDNLGPEITKVLEGVIEVHAKLFADINKELDDLKGDPNECGCRGVSHHPDCPHWELPF